jgi:toxin ParE1/3/4
VSRYHLSELAKEDLLEIFLYTLEIWGEEQVPIYLNLVEATMLRIAETPFILGSKARDDVARDCRTYRCGKHVIVYRIYSSHVSIARILHESMDFSRHIDEETFP